LNVNDFTIHVASANGTGSQSSNLTLMRGIFYMGVPVVAKNLFPSNIQGLPTWYNLRVSKDDYRARSPSVEILVCMNQDTVQDDLQKVDAGAVCFVREKLKYECTRDDIEVIPFPADKIIKDVDAGKLKKLVINFIYVGVLAEYLGIDRDSLEKGASKVFKGKAKAVGINMAAVDAGIAWTKENVTGDRKYKIEKMEGVTDGRLLVEGNSASALGAMFAGCTVLTWYPITPSSSMCEALISYSEKYRKDENGKSTFAHIQAEDELASVGMVIGASWAGARACTATAGPGISLMGEFIGLAYFTETPAVIVNVQRMGPSTGLPTRTSQGDTLSTYTASHGDSKHVLLFPSTPDEAFDMTGEAFDLAERLQTPVFVMLDLDLGMNTHMSEPFQYPEKPYDRGKVLDDEALAKLDDFRRYADIDGDGIPYRTVPGTSDPKAAWFARGTGHTPAATYSEDPDNYREMLDRLSKKFETARKTVPAPVVTNGGGTKVGLIAYGTSHQAIEETNDRLKAAGEQPVDYMRIRSLPIDVAALRDFVEKHDKVYVVDQNRDAQMADILRLEVPDLADKFGSILTYDGFPPTCGQIMAGMPEITGIEV
jgi:2-oxoglutarate ferredoxin oxidoreductase subunit alpha